MRRTVNMLLSCVLLTVASNAGALQVGQATATAKSGSTVAEQLSEQAAFQRGCVSLNQAVAQVRRQYNGQIVSAETRVSGNRETHIIKVLTQDGKVKTVRVAGCNRN